jgi:hypothetical protein
VNQLKRLAIGIAAVLCLALLIPTGSFATAHVATKTSCTGDGADFAITLGFDSTKLQPTATPSSNGACVAGGNSISFNASNLPSGMTWTVVFPQPTLGQSVLANNCTFGNGTNQSSSCTVITDPPSGDYYYTVIESDANGTYTLDPRVIIGQSGMPGSAKHHKHAGPKAATPPSQQ